MTKREYLEYLIPALELLERVEHVTDLFNHGRYEELDVIAGEIDHKMLDEFKESEEFEEILNADIPTEYQITWAVYLHRGKHEEDDIMGPDAWLWIEDIRLRGPVGEKLAKWLDKGYINDPRTFAEILGC